MEKDVISLRQLLVLTFAGLLSPALQLLPGAAASRAGEAGWLAPLFALPALLLAGWVILLLLRGEPERGLAGAFERALGRPLGRGLTALYLLWGLVCLAAELHAYGQRFLSIGYRNVSLTSFIVLLLGLVLWLAWGKLSAFARAGEIFFLVLSLTVGAVLLFALFNLEVQNVLPLWVEDLPAGAAAAVPVLDVAGYGIFGGFLAGQVRREERGGRRAAGWAAAFCLTVAAVLFVSMGVFGPQLLTRMEAPFFMTAKSIGLRGGFQRVESLVLAVWVLSDLVLAGVLVFACSAMARELFGGKGTGPAGTVIILLGGAGAVFGFPDAFALEWFTQTVLLWGNLLFGALLPGLAALVGALRGKI